MPVGRSKQKSKKAKSDIKIGKSIKRPIKKVVFESLLEREFRAKLPLLEEAGITTEAGKKAYKGQLRKKFLEEYRIV